MKTPLPLLLLSLALTTGLTRGATSDLASSASGFVRAQAQSPVHWETWKADTLARAKQENKPVYLFIGGSLNELSRATCQQSFANVDSAAFLNSHFVCVFVDREEQPDIAAAARLYLETMKQSDGWPIHLWLTPELQPYEGAGYLPPSEEWGRSGFSMVARQAGEAWQTNPKACRGHAAEAVSMMALRGADPLPNPTPAQLKEKIAQSVAAWRSTYDEKNGGFGTVPKALEPELLRFLLQQAPEDRAMAVATLKAVVNGATRDPLDGGFFRYSSDPAWRIPYLQKTLADQARMALALLDAAKVTGDAAFARTARAVLDYALHHLTQSEGGFAAAEDGTTTEAAGYYVWTAAEIDTVLGADAAAFKAAYGVAAAGNLSPDEDLSGVFRGKNILYRATPPGDTAAESTLSAACAKLRSVRDRRPAPAVAERATAGAQGLMLAALARAAEQLNEPAYQTAAGNLFEFVQKQIVLSPAGDLRRMRGSNAAAAPVDYAALALGSRDFGRVAQRADASAFADKLLTRAGALFFDPMQGCYLAAPTPLPTGLFFRAPAFGGPPDAEPLALLAGAPAEQAALLIRALSTQLGNGSGAAGDVLLALEH